MKTKLTARECAVGLLFAMLSVRYSEATPRDSYSDNWVTEWDFESHSYIDKKPNGNIRCSITTTSYGIEEQMFSVEFSTDATEVEICKEYQKLLKEQFSKEALGEYGSQAYTLAKYFTEKETNPHRFITGKTDYQSLFPE